MKNRVLFLFMGLLLLPVFSTGAPADDMVGEAPLVVVHSNETPPLAFIGFNGEPKGVVVDYWKTWSHKNRIPIKIVLTEWPNTLAMIREGKADIHGGLYYNEERAKFLDYSEPYFTLEAAIFARKGLGIDSIADIGDRPVAVLDKGYSEFFLEKNYPAIRTKKYKSSKDMVQAAVAGEVDAMLTEYTTLVHQLGAVAKVNAFTPVAPLYSRSLRAAVAKGNTRLLERVKQGEAQLTDKDRDRVFSRWVIETSSNYPWWKIIAFIGFALVLAIFLFMRGRRG